MIPRLAVRVLLAVGVVYAGICAFLLIEQNNLLYIGISLPPHDPALNLPAFDDANGAQIGWIATPAGPVRGTIVFFHGNDEEAWQADQNYAGYFTARGWRVVFPEYRGFDFRSGLAPTHDNVVADAVADMRFAAQKFPEQKLWVAGNSLGAGIAALAAKPGGAQGVLLFVPWDRMSAVAQERYPFVPTRLLLAADGTDYDSCTALAGIHVPVFITYAVQDDIIPAHHALKLAACLGVPAGQVFALATATHLNWEQKLNATQWDTMLGDYPLITEPNGAKTQP